MEIGGGPVLRAVLRQLSTAAALRTLPTPCRARAPGRIGSGEGVAIQLTNARLGLRDSSWGEGGVGDAGLEVWDLDDGFSLPPPLLQLEGGALEQSLEPSLHQSDFDMPVPSLLGEEVYEVMEEQAGLSGEPSEEILHQILVERLRAEPALLPLAAAVLAGGRRFPQARGVGTRQGAPTPGGGRWMRFRQQRRTPNARQGAARGTPGRPQARRGR